MSESPGDPPLDPCGCCAGTHAEVPVGNAPGLPALRYRLDTHGGFLERMLRALSLATPPGTTDPGAARPLAPLTTRTSDDPTVALLDACASVADVLTFYQERLANEGFLRTATERRSVLELARAIGYELAPGVAASVYLSFTVEDAPGSPGLCLIPHGTQVQSVPPQDKLPQVFETSADFTAHAEWNALRPRLTRPADLAIFVESGSKRLCLVGPAGTFPPETPRLEKADKTSITVDDLYWLTPPVAVTAVVDVVEVQRVYFTDTAPNVTKGELLLFVGKKRDSIETLVRRVAGVALEAAAKRIRVDLEPLPEPSAAAPQAAGLTAFPHAVPLAAARVTVRPSDPAFNRATVESVFPSRTWRERDFKALVGMQRGSLRGRIYDDSEVLPPPPIALDSGAFSFREKLAFFGHNAPRWGSLPEGASMHHDPYPKGWDVDDDADPASPPATLTAPRTIWMNSQGSPAPAGGPHAYLEHAVAGLVSRSWIVVENPSLPSAAYSVRDARETSRADYGLSGRAMALTLADVTGKSVDPNPLITNPLPGFSFRTTTARANSSRLDLAELPIASPIERGATAIELGSLALGLDVGQPVVFQGERADLPGVPAAEVAFLADTIHGGGHTTLLLREGLAHTYVREGLTINANTVHATHGETVREVLGNGDAALANQHFVLKKPPLTHVSAPTPRGVQSTLEVRVNGVRWDAVDSLYGVEPQREVYVVRIDDDARAHVTFGDGVRGARLLTGSINVAAMYRSGIGPDGEVAAGSLTLLRMRPLGLRGVDNALPAGGAAAPERLKDARRNAPLTVLTFDRVVSPSDYEDFARTFPGVGKALGDRLWVQGRDVVHVTVTGATGGEPDADVVRHLKAAIGTASDGSQPVVVSPFTLRYFTSEARVAVDPRFVAADVLAAVDQRLREAFGFEARELGQSVTAAEVIAMIQGVEGVVAVDLGPLAAYGAAPGPAAPAGAEAVPSRRARWNEGGRTFEAAELLLVNPAGLVLAEMAP